MRSAVLGAAVATLAFVSNAAMAADILPSPYAASARNSAYFWQGPYVGANLGYQAGSTTGNPTRPSGMQGGLQAGYTWQYGQFVFGAETDVQMSDADDLFAPWKFSNPWFGTLRARAGFALNNVLFYGTAGLAYGHLRAQNTLTGITESKTHAGWAAGAGMEVALTTNWSAKAEFLYVDLSDRPYSLTGVRNGLESSLLRMGVNYRF